MVAVDEDIVSLEIPRSAAEGRLSMHVKDAMREGAIADIAAAWYELAARYRQESPELAAAVLASMERYVSWVDIGLVANERFLSLLQGLMASSVPPLQRAAIDVVTEVLCKRMEAVPKLQLVEQLGVVPVCVSWGRSLLAASATNGGGGGGGDADRDDDLLASCAKLLATLCTEVMDCLKRVENAYISLTAVGVSLADDATQEVVAASAKANALLGQLLPAVLSVFRSHEDEVSLPLLPFLGNYVARLKQLQKRGQALPPDAARHVQEMLEGVALCSRYAPDSAVGSGPPRSQAEAAVAREETGDVEEKRRDLFNLFRNIAKLDFPACLAYVGSLLQAATARPDAPWQSVEVAVTLLHALGEGQPEEVVKLDAGALGSLVLALLQASPSLPAAHHRLVATAVLEAFVRYSRVLERQQQYLPAAVMTFVDGRGMGHPCNEVSTRACYLFSRLVKTLRAYLVRYTATILQSLEPHLSRVATTPLVDGTGGGGGAAREGQPSKVLAPATAVVDDRLYVFDTVGILLGLEGQGSEEQHKWLQSLLQPLLRQIEQQLAAAGGSPAAPGLVLQAMEAVSRLSKGFSTDLVTRLRPACGALFSAALDVVLRVPQALPGNKLVRSRFISFLHRMVELLQQHALPYLPPALQVLMHTQADAPDMTDVLSLLVQLLSRYKEQLQGLLEQLLSAVVSRVHALLLAGSEWDWTGPKAAGVVAAALAAAGGGGGGSSGGGGASALAPAGAGEAAAASTTSAAAAASACSGATLEEAREKHELVRGYFALLHCLTHHGLSGALLKLPPQALDAVMDALTRAASRYGDTSVRRTCVQTLTRLVGEWCGSGAGEVLGAAGGGSQPSSQEAPGQPNGGTGGGGGDAVPGFRRYAMERLGGQACVLSLWQPISPVAAGSGGGGALPPSPPPLLLDPRDPGTLSLLGDLATALKLVYERCGDALVAHLCTDVLPHCAGAPQEPQQALVYHLRSSSDVKEVKECLRALLVAAQGGGRPSQQQPRQPAAGAAGASGSGGSSGGLLARML